MSRGILSTKESPNPNPHCCQPKTINPKPSPAQAQLCREDPTALKALAPTLIKAHQAISSFRIKLEALTRHTAAFFFGRCGPQSLREGLGHHRVTNPVSCKAARAINLLETIKRSVESYKPLPRNCDMSKLML